jgi:hypothetical protein
MTAAAAIALIKTLHTAVFLVASTCILYALYCGIVGRASRKLLLAAIAIPSLIGMLWWLNGRECLLSSMIYRLADGDRTQADIFLPDGMARLIMPVSTPLLALAIVLVLWRQLMHRPSPPNSEGRSGKWSSR